MPKNEKFNLADLNMPSFNDCGSFVPQRSPCNQCHMLCLHVCCTIEHIQLQRSHNPHK